jgi:hypothetical protein
VAPRAGRVCTPLNHDPEGKVADMCWRSSIACSVRYPFTSLPAPSAIPQVA